MLRSSLKNCGRKLRPLLNRYCTNASNFVEIEIPVPWGKIAGKWWGPKENRPILVLHGYQDNCGSFDRLLPALSTSHSFLAVDSPGHGYSSQIPKGMFYNFINGPLLIQHICEYFKWSKVSLMGHSMGSMSCFTYTTYLPDNVDLLICLDGLYPIIFPNHTERTGRLIQKFFKYSDIGSMSNEPPSYTFEEMEKKLHEGSKKSVQIECAKYILKRNIAPSRENPGLYYFTIDPRLKAGVHFMGVPSHFKDDGKRIHCPLLVCVPQYSPFFSNREFFEDYANTLKAQENVEWHFVPGSHHVHLNEPEHVQKLISTFLEKNYKNDSCTSINVETLKIS